jgi:hypothetical protein
MRGGGGGSTLSTMGCASEQPRFHGCSVVREPRARSSVCLLPSAWDVLRAPCRLLRYVRGQWQGRGNPARRHRLWCGERRELPFRFSGCFCGKWGSPRVDRLAPRVFREHPVLNDRGDVVLGRSVPLAQRPTPPACGVQSPPVVCALLPCVSVPCVSGAMSGAGVLLCSRLLIILRVEV